MLRSPGSKKVDNYVAKIVHPHIELRRRPDATDEDLEALMIERNRRKEEIDNFKTVERIIDQRDAPPTEDIPREHLEYLCKWKGLDYDACTWEDHDAIKDQAAGEIRSYLARLQSRTLPAFNTPTQKRPPYKRIHEEPEYIKVGGSLKDFQVTGLNWLAWLWHHRENGILADEVGSPDSPEALCHERS